MASYNVEEYIDHCLTSILNQTMRDFEIIIVDDHSADNTLKKIRAYRDTRIRLLTNGSNLGPSRCRNRAIDIATGKYYAFIDSDDWIAEDRFECLIKEMGRLHATMISDNQLSVRSESEHPWMTNFDTMTVSELEVKPEYYIDHDLGMKPIIKSNVIRDNQLRFDEKLKYGEDYLFFFDCLRFSKHAWILKKGWYYYRTRCGSLMTNKVELFRSTVDTTKKLLKDPSLISNPSLIASLEKRLARRERALHYCMVIEPLKKGNYKESLTLFLTNYKCAEAVMLRLPLIAYNKVINFINRSK